MARTECFLAPSSLWEDGNGAAHVAVSYLVLERISEGASTEGKPTPFRRA